MEEGHFECGYMGDFEGNGRPMSEAEVAAVLRHYSQPVDKLMQAMRAGSTIPLFAASYRWQPGPAREMVEA